MKKYFIQMKGFAFITILIIGTSCNRQIRKDIPKENVSESSVRPFNQQKLLKSQSINKGDNIQCSLQDKMGNLWFGTTGDGLFKYDGKLFTQFTITNGLNSNTVWSMLEDNNGKIWIGSSDGVCIYHDNKFTKIKIGQPNDTTRNKYDVWTIKQDKRGKLWFATQIGIYIYDGKSFTSFKLTENVKDCYFRIEKILEDKDGNFWFGGRCNQGVYRYDGKTISHHKPNGNDWAWPALQDKKGNIWFSNWKGVSRYDGNSYTSFAKKDGLFGDMVSRITEDKNGNLWFGGDGLTRYDGNSFTSFTEKDGLLNKSVWSILEDNSSNLWVGTRETGLYFYDRKSFIKFSE